MRRGYRLIIIAALSSLGASSTSHAAGLPHSSPTITVKHGHVAGSDVKDSNTQLPAARADAREADAEQRESRTLAAAELSARAADIQASYARPIVILTAIGTLIAIVGTGLVYKTFQETRQTAKAAIEANKLNLKQLEAAYRPWVDVKISGPYIVDKRYTFHPGEGSRPISIKVRVQIENAGEYSITVRRGLVGVYHNRPELNEAAIVPYMIIPKGHKIDALGWNPKAELIAHESETHQVDLATVRVGFFLYRPDEPPNWPDPFPVYIRLVCADPLGNAYEIGRAFAPTKLMSDNFTIWGGEEYNYDRKLEQPSV